MDGLKLSLDEIESKEFRIDIKGYSMHEVDYFLDLVMEDYQAMQDVIEEYHNKCQHFQKLIDQLSLENQNLNTQLAEKPDNQATMSPSMVDVVRRLSRLEEVVFGHKQ